MGDNPQQNQQAGVSPETAQRLAKGLQNFFGGSSTPAPYTPPARSGGGFLGIGNKIGPILNQQSGINPETAQKLANGIQNFWHGSSASSPSTPPPTPQNPAGGGFSGMGNKIAPILKQQSGGAPQTANTGPKPQQVSLGNTFSLPNQFSLPSTQGITLGGS